MMWWMISMLVGCGSTPLVVGSGQIVTETFPEASSSYLVDFPGKIWVEQVSSVDQEGMSMTCDDNILARVQVEFGSEVQVWTQGGNFRPSGLCELVIWSSRLTELETHGSSDIEMHGSFPDLLLELSGSGDVLLEEARGDRFRVEASGSGDIEVQNLVSSVADFQMDGSGDVEVFYGAVDDLVLFTDGSGDVEIEAVAANGDVSMSGSGDVGIHVTGLLDVHMSGSGDLTIKGDPRLEIDRSGSGDVDFR